MRLLVRRAFALGDVILTTAVVARLRKENPDAVINVETMLPQVYLGNPHITAVNPGVLGYDRIIDLDASYESDRHRHGIDAYMMRAFGDEGEPQDKGTFLASVPLPQSSGIDWENTIVIHPARSWKCRTLPLEFWQRLAFNLEVMGYQILVTGTLQDHTIGTPAIDAREQLSLHEQAAVISAARCFIGSDSGPLFIAGATETPIVGLLNVTRAEYAMPYRHGQLGWNFTAVPANVSCYGCWENQPAIITNECLRGDFACLETFDPRAVANAAEALIHSGI